MRPHACPHALRHANTHSTHACMFTRTFLCMRVCTRVLARMCAHANARLTHLRIQHMHVCLEATVCSHARAHIRVRPPACAPVCTHAHLHTCTLRMCVYSHVHAHARAHSSTRMHARMHVQNLPRARTRECAGAFAGGEHHREANLRVSCGPPFCVSNASTSQTLRWPLIADRTAIK